MTNTFADLENALQKRFKRMTVADVLNYETTEMDHFEELGYRRGYCDGWIQAANFMFDVVFKNKTLIYNLMFDHWYKELADWMKDKKDEIVWPPEAKGLICTYCGINKATQIDHIYPKSRGGSDESSNLTWACGECNREKLDRTPEEWTDRWYRRVNLGRIMGDL